MTAYEQRSYAGNAADTLLNADLAAGGTSFSVTPGTGSGYPDGSQGPFFVFLDYDNSKIEKVRCSGRINDTFTVAASGGGRGQDGTTAQAHTANAKVRHGLTATDAQENNRAAAGTVGLITSKGDSLWGTGANALARVAAGANNTVPVADSTQAAGVRWASTLAGLTLTSPTLNSPTSTGAVLDATSTIGGVSGTTLAADRTAWASFTPTLTSITLGNGTLTAAYKQVGKRVYVRIILQFGSTTTIANGSGFSTPVNPVAGITQVLAGVAFSSSLGQGFSIAGRVGHTSNFILLVAQGNVTGSVPFTWGNGDKLELTGVYEAA